jgi:aryl-alcohol dehydrogenase-like predicted oxidoreductase
MGLGCLGLTSAYGVPPNEADAIALLRCACDLGVTFFDTAEIYGPWINEILVGKAIRGLRDRVVIATKFGFDLSSAPGTAPSLNSRPEHIRDACDGSLKRLGVETIDLFYQHRVDPNVPIEDVAGAVGELVQCGKVRYFGLSEAGARTIQRAHKVHPVSALQTEYSLWSREVEREILPACRELGIGFVAYSPLGRGFLAGAVTEPTSLAPNDTRRRQPRMRGDALESNRRLVTAIAEIASQLDCKPAQLALAWLMHQGDDVVPIPGTTKVHRLEENLAAVDLQLSDEQLAAIEAAVPEGAVEGERHTEDDMSLLDR